jgi:hypothetical protein
VAQDVEDRRPERGKAEAAGDEQDVAAASILDRPRRTVRMVCTSRAGSAGSPLIEIGTSPTPWA